MASTPCSIKTLIGIFVILAGANVALPILAMRTSNDKNNAYEERLALSSAMHEVSLASSAMTRWMRFFAITGGEFQYNAYWEEVERNRMGQALDIFTAFGVPQNEIELLRQILGRRALMSAIEYEVLRLRAEGDYQGSIAMAHGPEMAALGIPLEDIVQNLIALTHARTQEMLDSAARRTDMFEILILVIMIPLVMVCGFVLIGKVRKTKPIKTMAVVFIVLAGANIFFSVSAAQSNREISRAYELQTVLSSAVYNVELGTEAMTRWARMFVVTGSQVQYDLYWEEIEHDRFGLALDIFITRRAPDCEVNTLVDLVGRVIALRQIEAQFIQLRLAGYTQQAINMSFSPEVAAIGIPTNALSQKLREMAAARTREMVNAASHNHNTFKALRLVTAVLLFMAGLVALIIKLRYVNSVSYTQKVAPDPYIIRRIKNATIAARLAASFALVIAVFIVYVVITVSFNAVIDNLHRHNTDFMMDRAEIVSSYHQEFTEMRRLLQESFMNPEWLETANEGIWRSFEQKISASHARLTYLAALYADSIRADQVFPETPADSRLRIMAEIMAYADTIYEIYSSHFFLSGSMCFYHGNVLDYAGAAEIMIQMLRRISAVSREIVAENIERNRNLSNSITITTLIAAIVLALYLAYSMVKTFTGRIKTIEANATLVEQGNFEATLQNKATDEISKIFTNMVKVFTGLIDEIDEVARENAKGNTQIRINTERFQGGYQRAALVINTLIDAVLEQQEKMQTAQENSQAKSKFLARMSHEIRTPISAVLGISEIHLQNSALPLELEEAFAKIYSSAYTLLGIVNDVLDLSKIEAGKMELFNEKYELASLLSDIAQLQLAYMGSKQLAFIIDVDENIPSHLIGDELRIKQVLNNLLSNAFKYTVKGTVNLKVYIKDKNQNGYVDVVIVVSDTGRGMNEEQLKALFDEYARFHEKEARFETGTGLGMPITASLLKMMDATIDVDSEVGKGTTVTIVLPQKIGSHETLGPGTVRALKNFNADAHFAAKRLSFTPEPMPYGRVLIVDDIDANIYVAKGLMMLYKLHIDTCASGLAAIEKIERGEVYDIIFMDQMMPEMDGMEAAAIIRKMNYSHPIVALTANALVGQAELFLQNGFDGFLSKPIQAVHLNAVLHKFVKDRRPEAAAGEDGKAKYQNIEGYFEDYLKKSGIYGKLYKDFAHSQKNTMLEMKSAIEANDLKTAHRLAHTLKSLAGFIGEKGLLNMAEKAETDFREGVVSADLLDSLGLEMERIFAEIRAQHPEVHDALRAEQILDKDRAREVFDALAQLLEGNSFGALKLCGDLAEIPQATELINQIEQVDFAQALETLANLRKTLEV